MQGLNGNVILLKWNIPDEEEISDIDSCWHLSHFKK